MKEKGFTLIELVVVIVILGILAATAVPKFVNFEAEAKTATLQAVKASLEGAAALVYGKSLVKGNHTQAFSFSPPNTVNIGDGKGTNSDGELYIHYGYPVGVPSEFLRLIDIDSSFKIIPFGTNLKTFVVYIMDDGAPSSINDDCLVSYTSPDSLGEKPNIKVNPCT